MLATESHAGGTLPYPPHFQLDAPDQAALTVGRCYPSGFRVLAEHDPRQPLVSVTLMVGNGSGADPEGMGGLAHLAEHLWFRARPGGGPSIEDRLAAMGATSNAFTLQDVVMFETVVHRDHLEDLLRLEALRFDLERSGWTEELLTAEKQIVAQEARDRGAPTWMVDAVREQLFPAPHPYGTATGPSVEAATLDDVVRWWAEQVRPEKATLVVRGDWSPYQVQALATSVFPIAGETAGRCAARNDAVVTVPDPAPLEQHERVPAPIDFRAVLMAWSLPAAYGDDDWAMRGVADRIESHLAGKVYEHFGLASLRRIEPSCRWWPGAQGSTLACVVPLLPGRQAARSFRLMTAGIEQMQGLALLREYTAWTTELAKADEVADALRSRGVLSTLEPSVGDLVLANDLLAHFAGVANPAVRRVSAALRGSTDISAIARQYVTPDRAVWVELVPQRGEEESAPLASLVIDVPAPPADSFGGSDNVASPKLGGAKDFTLENGLRVIGVPFGSAPVVHVALVENGPSLGDFLDGMHVALDVPADISNVHPKYGLTELEVATHFIGSRLVRDFVDGRPVSMLETSSENLADALYVLRTAGPESSIASHLVRALNKMARKQKPEPTLLAAYSGLETLLGTAAAERLHLGTPETIDQDALESQHQRWHRPETSTLYVVGKLGESFEGEVRKAFEGWTAPALTDATPPLTSARAPSVVLPDIGSPTTVVVDGSGRATVSLVCRLPKYSAPELAVLRHAVRDATYREARERQGLVYTPFVGTFELRHDVPATLLLVSGSTDAETAGALLEALDASIAPTAGGWWKRARARASIEHALEIHGLAGLTRAFVSGDVLLDGTVLWAIDDARADAIRADLATCRDTRFALVIGPRDAVEASLDNVRVGLGN